MFVRGFYLGPTLSDKQRGIGFYFELPRLFLLYHRHYSAEFPSRCNGLTGRQKKDNLNRGQIAGEPRLSVLGIVFFLGRAR